VEKAERAGKHFIYLEALRPAPPLSILSPRRVEDKHKDKRQVKRSRVPAMLPAGHVTEKVLEKVKA
jgi:hypothetical protein